jgi:hypothetical protein
LTAELLYREHALHQYQWRVKRKAELIEEQRQRKLEAERAQRERLNRIEQARVSKLLDDARAFQQAGEIRGYVAAIGLAQANRGSHSMEEFQRWSEWALGQADRIDPAIGGTFLAGMQGDEESKGE